MLTYIIVSLLSIAVWIEFGEAQPDKAEWVRKKFQAFNDAVMERIWPND